MVALGTFSCFAFFLHYSSIFLKTFFSDLFWPFKEKPNWKFQPFLSFPKRRALKEKIKSKILILPNQNFQQFLSFPQRIAFTWCLSWTLLTNFRLKIPWTSKSSKNPTPRETCEHLTNEKWWFYNSMNIFTTKWWINPW